MECRMGSVARLTVGILFVTVVKTCSLKFQWQSDDLNRRTDVLIRFTEEVHFDKQRERNLLKFTCGHPTSLRLIQFHVTAYFSW